MKPYHRSCTRLQILNRSLLQGSRDGQRKGAMVCLCLGLLGDELFLNSDRTGAHPPSSRPVPLHHVMSDTYQNRKLQMSLVVQQHVVGAEQFCFGEEVA
jgi:hypothetical protein